MSRILSRVPLPLSRKMLLGIRNAAGRLQSPSTCELAARTAVMDAYSGRRCPDILSYDTTARQHLLKIAGEILEELDLKGRTVLDIGCGAGILTRQLLAAGAGPVISVDWCENMLAQCRDRVSQAGLDSAACTFIQANAADLPLPDASADVIVSSLMLDLVPRPTRVVHEMLRVLKPGGRLSLAAQGATCLAELQAVTLRHIPLRYLLVRPPAFWPLTSREAHGLCADAGLAEISVKHAYWQNTFPTPEAAYAFTVAASANLWASGIPDHALDAVTKQIRQQFSDRRIVRLTQDIVFVRAIKPAD